MTVSTARATATTLGPREVAERTGVSTDTLRHYERKGLLDRPPRTGGGYRRYPAAAVSRVQLIQRALRIGFSLDELRQVLDERRRGGAPCRSVRALVADRLSDLNRQIRDLQALRADMKALLAAWDQRLARTGKGRRANLLDMLIDGRD